MRYPQLPDSLLSLEEEMLARWQEEDLFRQTMDATADGSLDRTGQTSFIERRENDRVDPTTDEILNDLDLKLSVVLPLGSHPDYLDIELGGGL